MTDRKDIFILNSDAVLPTGMNLPLAVALARADLGRFDTKKDEYDGVNKTIGHMDFIQESKPSERVFSVLELLLNSLLNKLHRSLKPLPLLLSLPHSISKEMFDSWFDSSPYTVFISRVSLHHKNGCEFIETMLDEMKHCDAIISISLDNPAADFDSYAENKALFSSTYPWGVIPSEGAAGVVLVKANLLSTLKLTAESKIVDYRVDYDSKDRRGCSRLVKACSNKTNNLGKIYSDMTSSRSHSENYGFAVGARSEYFIEPDHITQVNELWGYLRNASALVCLTLASREISTELSTTLFLFNHEEECAILRLSLE